MLTDKEILLEVRSDIKEIKEDVAKIKQLDAVQNEQLRQHMARTEANEKRLDKLENFKWFFAILIGIVAATAEFLRNLFN